MKHDLDLLQALINEHFDQHLADISPANAPAPLKEAVQAVLGMLDEGQLRLCRHDGQQWQVESWLKKAILLSFRLSEHQCWHNEHTAYYDKIASKYHGQSAAVFQSQRVRVVPPAYVRFGAYIAPDVVLMPSFVNVGAYIGQGSMIDTWASVGSCAQIGQKVHISGGAGIGGVLEPLQATPTIIENHCFIGARSEIVEGVIVGAHSVIAMGVFIGQSTKIYDRCTGKVHYGYVPPGSVVVPGSLPAADGSHSLNAAIIVKQIDAKTRSRTSINELLRP